MACMVAGPDGSGFLAVGLLQRISIQESPTHTIKELKHAVRVEITIINQELLRRGFDSSF
jgi:hypothetical protein